MGVPEPACTHCGKNFTFDDLRGTTCKHCGTVLAHHQRAAQQVAVIGEMMADRNGNGIPDAYEGMVAGANRNAAAHVGAVMTGNPGASPYAGHPGGGGYGGYPSAPAGGFGAYPPGGAPPGMGPIAPYGNPQAAAAVAAGMSGVVIAIVAVSVVAVLLVVAGAFFALLMVR